MRRKTKTPSNNQSASAQAAEEAIADDRRPEFREALERLTGEGLSRSDALEMIGAVVMAEVYDQGYLGRPFDRGRVILRLEALPDLSWVDD